jgi:hypothetical protein
MPNKQKGILSDGFKSGVDNDCNTLERDEKQAQACSFTLFSLVVSIT